MKEFKFYEKGGLTMITKFSVGKTSYVIIPKDVAIYALKIGMEIYIKNEKAIFPAMYSYKYGNTLLKGCKCERHMTLKDFLEAYKGKYGNYNFYLKVQKN